MSQKFYKDKEFLKLQKQWYKKVKKETDFKDIEQDEDHLVDWSDRFYRQKFLDTYEAKAEYYYMATHFLNDYKFETTLDKIIWEYHSNGISFTNISKLLKKVRKKVSRDQVEIVINKLKTAMRKLYKENKDE